MRVRGRSGDARRCAHERLESIGQPGPRQVTSCCSPRPLPPGAVADGLCADIALRATDGGLTAPVQGRPPGSRLAMLGSLDPGPALKLHPLRSLERRRVDWKPLERRYTTGKPRQVRQASVKPAWSGAKVSLRRD
jgi:hypothetical protein